MLQQHEDRGSEELYVLLNSNFQKLRIQINLNMDRKKGNMGISVHVSEIGDDVTAVTVHGSVNRRGVSLWSRSGGSSQVSKLSSEELALTRDLVGLFQFPYMSSELSCPAYIL